MTFVKIKSGNKFFDREEVGYLESFQEIMSEPTNLEDIKEEVTPPTPEAMYDKLAQLDKEAGEVPGLLTLTLDKEDLISLLDGFGTFWYMKPFMDRGNEKSAKLCTFTGDQWNPAWDWQMDKLAELTKQRLWSLYQDLKRERNIDRGQCRK
jgi:hypothetical protein